MTVEVINDKPDPSVVKEIICESCGVTLTYVPGDVKHRLGSFNEWIDCPHCKKSVIVRRKRISISREGKVILKKKIGERRMVPKN